MICGDQNTAKSLKIINNNSHIKEDEVEKAHPKGTILTLQKNRKGKTPKFRIEKTVGRGSFGVVFGGINVANGQPVAIKCEEARGSMNLLSREKKIYDKIRSKLETILKGRYTNVGFPKILGFGYSDDTKRPKYRYLAMDYLGQSVGHHFSKCKRFSLKTILMIGMEIISRLEVFHKCTFMHRDIKPENFMCGEGGGEKRGTIYIIDFGLCKRYLDPMTGIHIPKATGKSLVGTIRYAPIACHAKVEQSRKDDLESVGYMLSYFYLKRLPWQGIGRAERDDKINQKILELKKSFDKHLADVQAPNVFREYLANVRKLEYEEEPDYDALKNMFLEEMKSRNIACDMKFDWMDSAKARKSND